MYKNFTTTFKKERKSEREKKRFPYPLPPSQSNFKRSIMWFTVSIPFFFSFSHSSSIIILRFNASLFQRNIYLKLKAIYEQSGNSIFLRFTRNLFHASIHFFSLFLALVRAGAFLFRISVYIMYIFVFFFLRPPPLPLSHTLTHSFSARKNKTAIKMGPEKKKTTTTSQ